MHTEHHRPVGKGDRVFLVDASSFVFRAYFQSMNQDRKYNSRPTGCRRAPCASSRRRCCNSSRRARWG